MEYLTFAAATGDSEGSMIKGKTWPIPADVKKPEDPRKSKKKRISLQIISKKLALTS